MDQRKSDFGLGANPVKKKPGSMEKLLQEPAAGTSSDHSLIKQVNIYKGSPEAKIKIRKHLKKQM